MHKLYKINLIVLLDKIVIYMQFQQKSFCKYALLKLYQTHFYKTHYGISVSKFCKNA